jgi:hypothetical protein
LLINFIIVFVDFETTNLHKFSEINVDWLEIYFTNYFKPCNQIILKKDCNRDEEKKTKEIGDVISPL